MSASHPHTIARPTLTIAAIVAFVGAWNGFLAQIGPYGNYRVAVAEVLTKHIRFSTIAGNEEYAWPKKKRSKSKV